MAESSRTNFSKSEKLTGMGNYADWATRGKLLLQDRDCWDEIIVNPTDIDSLADGAPKKEPKKRLIQAMALLSQTVSGIYHHACH